MAAIMMGNIVTCRWLLAHHANPNAVDAYKLPVAEYAIDYGQPQMLDALVKAGANRRYHDPNGYGWMHYAVRQNYYLLDRVLSYGLSVDDRDGKGGMTPLMMSAQFGVKPASLWLLKHGANPNLKDKLGRDCFELSKQGNTLHTDRFFRDIVSMAKR
jgi:ankyrin repeat protein